MRRLLRVVVGFALAAVVVALVGIDLGAATAGVFLYRLSNYWFVVLVGAAASAALSFRPVGAPPVLGPEEELEELGGD